MIPFAVFQWFAWCMIVTAIAAACLLYIRRPRVPALVLSCLLLFSWLLFDRESVQKLIAFIAYEWLILEVSLAAVRAKNLVKLVSGIGVVLAILPVLMMKLGFLALLGTSYITFRAVQVLIDIYDGRIKDLSRSDYLLFLTFFPTIFAGPIDRFQRFSGDLSTVLSTKEVALRFEDAARHLWWGLFYKFVLAHLFKYAIENREHLIPAAKSIQEISYFYLYGGYLVSDFAGYAAIVIAFSLAAGIRTPENVDGPFLSTSIREFWQRMHITLSLWFRDYVFLRLVLFLRRRKIVQLPLHASIASLFLSFGLMGLWHGIEIRYVAYGLYHATLLAIQEIWEHSQRKGWVRWNVPTWLSWLVTFHLLLLGFAIFSGYVPGFWRVIQVYDHLVASLGPFLN